MGRLVRVPREVSASDLSVTGLENMLQAGVVGEARGASGYVQADNYLERIAKYVPAEVLAFSVFINAILTQELRSGGKTTMMAGFPIMTVATAVVIAGTLLTPFFVWYVRQKGDAWITNAFVSTLAFPFWSYGLGAAAFAPYWDGNLAAIVLASFSVVSGLISPRMPRRLRARKEKESEKEKDKTKDKDKDKEKDKAAVAAKERPHLVEAGKPAETVTVATAAAGRK